MQTETDAQRIRDLGAVEAEVLGNCKFDEAWRGQMLMRRIGGRSWGSRKVSGSWWWGSTRGEMEEEFVLGALKEAEGSWDRVIHAPRHLERAAELAESVSKLFGDVSMRSQDERGSIWFWTLTVSCRAFTRWPTSLLWAGDLTIWEGRTSFSRWRMGKPVIHGAHMLNFRDVSEMAAAGGGDAGGG